MTRRISLNILVVSDPERTLSGFEALSDKNLSKLSPVFLENKTDLPQVEPGGSLLLLCHSVGTPPQKKGLSSRVSAPIPLDQTGEELVGFPGGQGLVLEQ